MQSMKRKKREVNPRIKTTDTPSPHADGARALIDEIRETRECGDWPPPHSRKTHSTMGSAFGRARSIRTGVVPAGSPGNVVSVSAALCGHPVRFDGCFGSIVARAFAPIARNTSMLFVHSFALWLAGRSFAVYAAEDDRRISNLSVLVATLHLRHGRLVTGEYGNCT
jgi:hypothetical protein